MLAISKLLVIGNGFDLHLKLKSSFKDFFSSTIFKSKSQYHVYNDSDSYSIDSLLSGISESNSDEIRIMIKVSTEYKLKLYSHSIKTIKNVSPESKCDEKKRDVYNKNNNFWAMYFNVLKHFPDYSDANAPFPKYYEIIDSPSLERWSDIEYQILRMLDITKETFKSYCNLKSHDDYEFNRDDLLEQFEHQFTTNKSEYIISNIGALRLVALQLALHRGLNASSDVSSVYEFLYSELYDFEMMFSDYLSSKVNKFQLEENSGKKTYDYVAKKFARKIVFDADSSSDLSSSSGYSLINFNYTTFYSKKDPNKINVHSTLGNAHPIFGIDSTKENDLVNDEVFYRFTKVFRVMSGGHLSNCVFPKNVDKIIFYGHSLADADYSYFYALFDYYKIYDDNQIKLIFKYSDYKDSNNKNVDASYIQFKKVYKLINRFGVETNNPNLLQELLLENRISFQKVS